jgi:hypothetical protein
MTEKIAEGLKPLLTDIKSIKTDKRNARKHPVKNLDAIKLSLETYGQRKPIVVNAANDTIEAGNGLYLAAVALGWTQIAVVYVNDDETTSKAYGLMDNQSALISEWDLPILKDLLADLDNGAFDMDLTGFTSDEIEGLMNQEHQKGMTRGSGYVEGIEKIDPLKLAYRLESVAYCKKRDLAIDLFSGQGKLSFWYERLFSKVIRVDKEKYNGIEYNQKAINFLKEHLSEFINFDFIDFDDEGCPGKEMQLFFSLIKNKKEHFILCLTDGMGLNLKSRGKVNLFDKYLVGNDETVKASEINYRDFDQYVQNLIDKLCETNGFKNNVINWYRGAEGNVIYSCYEITQI